MLLLCLQPLRWKHRESLRAPGVRKLLFSVDVFRRRRAAPDTELLLCVNLEPGTRLLRLMGWFKNMCFSRGCVLPLSPQKFGFDGSKRFTSGEVLLWAWLVTSEVSKEQVPYSYWWDWSVLNRRPKKSKGEVSRPMRELGVGIKQSGILHGEKEIFPLPSGFKGI